MVVKTQVMRWPSLAATGPHCFARTQITASSTQKTFHDQCFHSKAERIRRRRGGGGGGEEEEKRKKKGKIKALY
jgi:hypothetical protein